MSSLGLAFLIARGLAPAGTMRPLPTRDPNCILIVRIRCIVVYMGTGTEAITFTACGHTDRVQITWTGGREQRERKAAWVAANLTCPSCREIATAARGIAAIESGLVGSFKQCAWAEDIRTAYLARWDETRARLEAAADTDERAAVMLARGVEIAATTDAKWWIDNARCSSIEATLLREFPAPVASSAPEVPHSMRASAWPAGTRGLRVGR